MGSFLAPFRPSGPLCFLFIGALPNSSTLCKGAGRSTPDSNKPWFCWRSFRKSRGHGTRLRACGLLPMWWFCCLRLQEMEHQLSIKPVRETSNWYGLENGVPNKQLVICIQFSVAPTMPPMPPHPGMAVSGIIAETMALSFMPIRCLFFRGRRQGRQPLNNIMYTYIYIYIFLA